MKRFIKEGQKPEERSNNCGTDLAYYLLIQPKNEKHVALLGVLGIHKYGPDGI